LLGTHASRVHASGTDAVPAGRCLYFCRSLFVRLCGKKCFLENRRDGSKYEVNYSYVNGLHVSFGRETKVGKVGQEGTIAKCGFRNVESKKAAQWDERNDFLRGP